ncbi:hypothetical protein [Candidatus Babela massiliensis]|nr:hypothetical protein [Candidatus Babela massiliensis]
MECENDWHALEQNFRRRTLNQQSGYFKSVRKKRNYLLEMLTTL